jgi:hypothetical protein
MCTVWRRWKKAVLVAAALDVLMYLNLGEEDLNCPWEWFFA